MTNNFNDFSVVWSGEKNSGVITKANQVEYIGIKPDIEIEFDSIYAENGNEFKFLNNKKIQLSPDEIHVIQEWFNDITIIANVMAADSNGEYLGAMLSNDARIAYVVLTEPPNNDNWVWGEAIGKGQEWVYVHGVDDRGKYLGNVPAAGVNAIADVAPIDNSYIWSGGEWVKPPPTPEELEEQRLAEIEGKKKAVRAECSRRLQRLMGASSPAHLTIKFANASREMQRLLLKEVEDPGSWTGEDEERKQFLKHQDAQFEAIRAASNLLEPGPPDDYADDKYWPEM
jgi:hypothetical protein